MCHLFGILNLICKMEIGSGSGIPNFYHCNELNFICLSFFKYEPYLTLQWDIKRDSEKFSTLVRKKSTFI